MISAAPESLLVLVRRGWKPRGAAAQLPLVELDKPAAIERAVLYLEKNAPEAVEGSGGNPTTYSVAAHVKDFGLSEDAVLDAMLGHWNENKAFPAWDPDALLGVIANAFAYGTSQPGAKSADAEFDAVEIVERQTHDGKELQPGTVSLDDLLPANLPPRQWLYGHKILRKYVTFLAAAGGAGKTAWVVAAMLGAASGRETLHDEVRKPLKVWVYNLEDPIEELRLRLAAAFKHYDLPASALDNVRLDSGRLRPFKIVKMGAVPGSYRVLPDLELAIAAIKREQIDVLVIDPFLRSHGVSENDNEAQDEVMRLYAEIAERANCGVVLVHHTKKGAATGDMEGMRGGSTQGGGARVVLLMSQMTIEDAGKLGIPETQRRLYVRLDDGKSNMAAPAERAEWIKLHGVDIGNATEEYPDGDNVQVATRWEPPDALDGMSTEEVNEALSIIRAGLDNDERYTARPQDKNRWAGTVLTDNFMRTPQQAKELLAGWMKDSLLELREYHSEAQRKSRKGLF